MKACRVIDNSRYPMKRHFTVILIDVLMWLKFRRSQKEQNYKFNDNFDTRHVQNFSFSHTDIHVSLRSEFPTI